MSFLAGFLGLGRPTALAILASSLELPKVFRAALGDLHPTLPSKLDGGGIFLFWQNSEEVASAPDRIMHDHLDLRHMNETQGADNSMSSMVSPEMRTDLASLPFTRTT